METALVASVEEPNIYFGGFCYPKDSNGNVLTQYWMLFVIHAWTETLTGRMPLPILEASNPAPNSADLIANYSAPYSRAIGHNFIQASDTGTNVTMFGKTIIGGPGLKVSTLLLDDSNVLNTTTEKEFIVTLTTSHPITSFLMSYTPTSFQQNFAIQTQYYFGVFNQPTFADGDGLEVDVNMTLLNITKDANGNEIGVALHVRTSWYQNWTYDPNIGITLNPGDGGSNSNLAYIALVALVLAPLAVIVVVAVGTIYFVSKRKRERRHFTLAVDKNKKADDVEDVPS